jgi:hypothetical protein
VLAPGTEGPTGVVTEVAAPVTTVFPSATEAATAPDSPRANTGPVDAATRVVGTLISDAQTSPPLDVPTTVSKAVDLVVDPVRPLVIDTATPIIDMIVAPVIDMAAPVLDTVTPIVDTIVGPVAETLAPIVDAVTPIVDTVVVPTATVAPVVDALAPIIDTATTTTATTTVETVIAPITESVAPSTDGTGTSTAASTFDAAITVASDDVAPVVARAQDSGTRSGTPIDAASSRATATPRPEADANTAADTASSPLSSPSTARRSPAPQRHASEFGTPLDDSPPRSTPAQSPILPAPATTTTGNVSDAAGANTRASGGSPFGVLPQAALLIGLFFIGMVCVRRIVFDSTADAVLARPG